MSGLSRQSVLNEALHNAGQQLWRCIADLKVLDSEAFSTKTSSPASVFVIALLLSILSRITKWPKHDALYMAFYSKMTWPSAILNLNGLCICHTSPYSEPMPGCFCNASRSLVASSWLGSAESFPLLLHLKVSRCLCLLLICLVFCCCLRSVLLAWLRWWEGHKVWPKPDCSRPWELEVLQWYKTSKSLFRLPPGSIIYQNLPSKYLLGYWYKLALFLRARGLFPK